MQNILFNAITQFFQNTGSQQIKKVITSDTTKNIAKTAGAAAAGAAAAGTIITIINKKNEEEAIRNSFNEGHKAGEEAIKQKFADFLKEQRRRDEFLLLITKIGMYVAQCDGQTATEEMQQLDIFIGKVNMSPVIPPAIKERISQIKQTSFTFCDIVSEMDSFLKEYDNESKQEIIIYVDQLIYNMINADGCVHPAEQEFMINWKRHFC